MNTNELKDLTMAKLHEIEALVEKVNAEKRDYTPEESEKEKRLFDEVEKLNEEVRLSEKRDEVKKKIAESKQPKSEKRTEQLTPEAKAVRQTSLFRMIRSQMRGTEYYLELDGIEKEMHDEAVREAKASNRALDGVGIPSFFVRMPQTRGLTAGTTTTGGHLIQTSVGDMIPFLNPDLVIAKLGATFLPLVGDFKYPRQDARGSGAWEGEGDDNAEVQPTLDSISLTPKRFGGYTFANKQVLLQGPGAELLMRQNLEQVLAEAIDSVAINGGGAGEPTGIIPYAGTGSVASGALSWAKVVELETTVANANAARGALAYLTTPGVRGVAKTMPKEVGQAIYLWQDGAAPGEGLMNGYRAVTSTLVPSTLGGGAEHGLIFGNWNDLLIGNWGGIDLVIDPYSLSKKAQIQIIANIWVDVDLRHPLSFATIEGVTV